MCEAALQAYAALINNEPDITKDRIPQLIMWSGPDCTGDVYDNSVYVPNTSISDVPFGLFLTTFRPRSIFIPSHVKWLTLGVLNLHYVMNISGPRLIRDTEHIRWDPYLHPDESALWPHPRPYPDPDPEVFNFLVMDAWDGYATVVPEYSTTRPDIRDDMAVYSMGTSGVFEIWKHVPDLYHMKPDQYGITLEAIRAR
jgi:hypothetical protein